MTAILMPLLLALLVTLSIGAIFRPMWGLVLVILMYALEQSLQGAVPIFRSFPPLANYWTAIVVALSAANAVFRLQNPFIGYATTSWLLSIGIFLWALLSLLWTPSTTAAKMTTDGLPYFVMFLVLAPLLPDSIADLRSFALLMMLFGTLTAVSIITNPEFNIESGRLGLQISFKVRSSPLAMGELGGTLVILAALYHATIRSPAIVLLRIASFVSGTILVLYSGSRGQLIFAALIAIAFFPVSRKIQNVFSFFATAVGLIIIGVGVMLLARFVFQTEGGMVESRWSSDLLTAGTQVRRENALDLLLAFATSPQAWIFGLGWNAFSAFTKASTEPYSHSVMLDILCELGIPAFIALCVILLQTFRASRRLFGLVSTSPLDRSVTTCFIALCAYQILLANKQGMLWAAGPLFIHLLALIRIDYRTAALGMPPDLVPQAAEDEGGALQPAIGPG
jgi:hypothetical protein